ncbi:MAG: hypothetical protein AB7W16_05725 [Candidatus Obscuribacterales bacterium]
MSTGSVTVGLPKGKLEKLKKLAKERNSTVESLAKAAILGLIDDNSVGGSTYEILQAISSLQACVIGRTEAIGSLSNAALKEAVVARYSSSKTLEGTDEILSLHTSDRLLNSKERKELRKTREAECEDLFVAEMTAAFGLSKPKNKKRRKIFL